MASDTNISLSLATSLTAEDVENIAHMEPYSAKDLLAKKLEPPLFDNTNNQQMALFISYMYDNIMFAAEKGFPWDHVCLVVTFAHEYLKRILVESHQLSDAIQDFTNLADILAPISDRHKKQYTDFVYDTVLCHYNLYKYVFLHPRDSVKPEVTQTVEVPPTPLPLSLGENKVIWEYNKKLKDVEEQEARALRDQQEMKDRLNKQPTNHKTLDDLNSVPLPYNEVVLKELAADVLSGLAEKKEMELKIKVDEVITDLSFKFQKASIPRPFELGASKQKSHSQSPPRTSRSRNGNSVKGKGQRQSSLHVK